MLCSEPNAKSKHLGNIPTKESMNCDNLFYYWSVMMIAADEGGGKNAAAIKRSKATKQKENLSDAGGTAGRADPCNG